MLVRKILCGFPRIKVISDITLFDAAIISVLFFIAIGKAQTVFLVNQY